MLITLHPLVCCVELPRTDFSKPALLLLTAGRASLMCMDWEISGAENTAGKSLSDILQKSKPSPWEMERDCSWSWWVSPVPVLWLAPEECCQHMLLPTLQWQSVSLLAEQLVKAIVWWVSPWMWDIRIFLIKGPHWLSVSGGQEGGCRQQELGLSSHAVPFQPPLC